MRRPFLLLQARNQDDPMLEHEIACFRGAIGLGADDLVVVNATDRLPTRDELKGVSAVLMGGSGDYSVLDRDPWIGRLVEWVRRELVLPGKATFASCFGFQILVLAIGGRMIRDYANTEMGTYDLKLGESGRDDPLFSHLPALFSAQVGHHDRAAALPLGARLLASTPDCPVHAFRVGHLPIWATQFHPELGIDDLRTRYVHYRALYAPGWVDVSVDDDPFLKGLRPSDEASLLLALFARWVEAHERELESLGL
ncbi:MAG: hypothetical protein KC502_03345 [Myxococcales bacterium]|nr:hypothetical protein [Myxococcales bacterium]